MKYGAVCSLVLLMLLLVILSGCSHLHVDLDSRWQLAHDAQILIQMDDPPDEISSEQICSLITQLG
ncbi:MAG: hypothetical protein J7K75_01110 [Desulfuromonas sp.]|nr:hypothetical protein [Desulfuromonas sp.]